MRATLAYTTLRLAIFVVALIVLYLVGARGIMLLALAALISAITSFVLLARQREAMAGSISRRISGVRERIDDGAQSEDID